MVQERGMHDNQVKQDQEEGKHIYLEQELTLISSLITWKNSHHTACRADYISAFHS